MKFHACRRPQKVGIHGLRPVAALLVKIAFLMKIEVFARLQKLENAVLVPPWRMIILCNCMQFACNVVRTC